MAAPTGEGTGTVYSASQGTALHVLINPIPLIQSGLNTLSSCPWNPVRCSILCFRVTLNLSCYNISNGEF